MTFKTVEEEKAYMADLQSKGEQLAEVLRIPVNPETGRYWTQWGDKTAIGLCETVKRIVGDGK